MNTHVLDNSRTSFIRAMRQVACSVTVVTTDGPAGRHGATVSAFSSVSADPPTILICLRGDSRIARQVEENGRFTVNVLTDGTSDVARAFTGEFDAERPDRFTGQDVVEFPDLAPGLGGATVFACRVAEVAVHGSHRIFLGRVVETRTEMRPPLTYHDGAYRRLAPLAVA